MLQLICCSMWTSHWPLCDSSLRGHAEQPTRNWRCYPCFGWASAGCLCASGLATSGRWLRPLLASAESTWPPLSARPVSTKSRFKRFNRCLPSEKNSQILNHWQHNNAQPHKIRSYVNKNEQSFVWKPCITIQIEPHQQKGKRDTSFTSHDSPLGWWETPSLSACEASVEATPSWSFPLWFLTEHPSHGSLPPGWNGYPIEIHTAFRLKIPLWSPFDPFKNRSVFRFLFFIKIVLFVANIYKKKLSFSRI